MDVRHRSPEYPADYVCHAQSFIDNLQTINQIYIKIKLSLSLLIVGFIKESTYTLSEWHGLIINPFKSLDLTLLCPNLVVLFLPNRPQVSRMVRFGGKFPKDHHFGYFFFIFLNISGQLIKLFRNSTI
jgi:hypothetical protein